MRNAKTTISGILTILLPILGLLLKWLNGEPITGSDMAMISAAASSGTGLWFARDAATHETVISQPMIPTGTIKVETKV